MAFGKKSCELCGEEASVHCDQDSAFLCWTCDARVHSANFLASRHGRQFLCPECGSFDSENAVLFFGPSLSTRAFSPCCSSSSSESCSSSSGRRRRRRSVEETRAKAELSKFLRALEELTGVQTKLVPFEEGRCSKYLRRSHAADRREGWADNA